MKYLANNLSGLVGLYVVEGGEILRAAKPRCLTSAPSLLGSPIPRDAFPQPRRRHGRSPDTKFKRLMAETRMQSTGRSEDVDQKSIAESLAFTKDWMLRCQSHDTCVLTRVDLGLPKRALDISRSDGIIMLRETEAEKAPYATLSYRWGDGVPLRTTQSTLEQHRAGIPLESFPATLKDAIVFAKDLGFQYVWIDALCIIQDDSLDWQQQSAAMTAIYHGCSLNIAIADAPNCNSGIAQNLKADMPTPDTYPKHRDSPLETRGWVFQETLVSTASVYITDKGLVWDCCSQVCGQGSQPLAARQWAHPSDHMTPKAMWADQKPISRLEPASGKKNLSVLRIWCEWVVMFSRRNLSNINDRLPAMAGLASRLQAASSATYAAGLWKEDIHVGLIWLAKSSMGLTRPGNGAPSWSWASVKGHLDYLWCLSVYCVYPGKVHVEEGLDLEVLDVSVDEVYPGTFGTVTGGRIDAIGTLQKGTLDFDEGDVEFDFELTTSRLDYCLDEPQDEGAVTRDRWLLRVASIVPTAAGGRKQVSQKRDGPFIHFLIVEETGRQENEFRRIGQAFHDASTIFNKRGFFNRDVFVTTDLFENGERKRITLV